MVCCDAGEQRALGRRKSLDTSMISIQSTICNIVESFSYINRLKVFPNARELVEMGELCKNMNNFE